MNTLFTALLTGSSIGILGSFHCIGMCGPLALALPVHQLPQQQRIIANILYNIGRATGYALMGITIGTFGTALNHLFGWQQGLSIFAALIILFFLLLKTYPQRFTALPSIINFSYLQQQLSNFLTNAQRPTTYFTIGFLNAFLPCGLVYIALASALAFAHPLYSGLTMLSFGFGTIPLMASLIFFGKYITLPWRQRINRLVPFFVLTLSLLLFIRGMGLNIPYLSPALQQQDGKCAVSCCHKPK